VNNLPVERARPGEFLYGIQHVEDSLGEVALAWYDLLGIDLLRGVGKGNRSRVADYTDTPAVLRPKGMKVLALVDPPKPGSPTSYDADGMDPAQRAKALARLNSDLEVLARTYPAELPMFELGNEPDLPFFYRSAMSG
jgi:hypothetical protein